MLTFLQEVQSDCLSSAEEMQLSYLIFFLDANGMFLQYHPILDPPF